MRLCPNPACPFRLRHGFAAEFQDRVERCRSCGAALDKHEDAAPLPSPPPKHSARAEGEAPGSAWPALARLGLSAGLLAVLVGLSRLVDLGAGLDLGDLCVGPGLRGLIAAAIIIELLAVCLPAGRALRARPEGRARLQVLTLALALLLVLAGGWLHHRALLGSAGGAPSLAMMLATRGAGLGLVLASVALNHRWGLGHGVSLVFAAVLVDALAPQLAPQLALLLALFAGGLVWLSRPARSEAPSRKRPDPDSDSDFSSSLGLGLTIPSSGLIPLELLVLAPLALRGLDGLLGWPGAGSLAGVLGPPGPGPGLGPGLALDSALPWLELLELLVLLALTAALAWLFTRPRLLLARWRHAFPRADPTALAHEARGLFRRGLLRSELLLALTWLLAHEQLPATAALALAAIVLDISAELRLRLRLKTDLALLPSLLDLPGAESLVLALELQHRPALLQARHHRALYHLFGWWLPTHILLRREDLDEARRLRAQLLASDAPPEP